MLCASSRKALAKVSDAARALHAKLFVADLHCDALMWPRGLRRRGRIGHVDIPRLVEGNVALQAFTAVTRVPLGANLRATADRWDVIRPLNIAQGWPRATWRSPLARALHQARRFTHEAERSEDRLSFIRHREDLEDYLVRRQAASGITAGLLGVEGLHSIEGDLANVDVLFDAGFRMMGPVHFFDNEVCGSAHGLGKGGLTPFGHKVVARMEQLGILMDLAHAAPRAIDDILDRATRPLVVSHTGVRGTQDNHRNLDDNHLKRIAANGGVAGIGFWRTAVGPGGVSAIVRAIAYAAECMGAEHVALGSDFDGYPWMPFDASGLVLLTDGLLKAGFAERDVAAVMGGNVLRILRGSLPLRPGSAG